METRVEFAGTFTSCGRCLLPRSLSQGRVNDEARSNRYRQRGHLGCDRWGGDGECTVLSSLRSCSNLYLARLHPPKQRLCSPPGRSAHCSVFRPEQSGSHRRWEALLQSSRPPLVGKRSIYNSNRGGDIGGGDELGLRPTTAAYGGTRDV